MTRYQKDLKGLEDYLILSNYSPSTCRAYVGSLRQFFAYHTAQSWGFPYTQEMAREYLLYRYKQGKKWQTINGDYSALCKLYAYVLDLGWSVKKLPRPRKERSIPDLISVSDVEKMINGAGNLRYQALILVFYTTGMRLSEVLSLKMEDIDSERLQIRVRKGKGAKDRLVNIPTVLVQILREYYKVYRPKVYLFNGKKKGERYSRRAAQVAITSTAKLAGITKRVTAHVLRHSYATHHLEAGTNLLYIQEMLGHKNIKTTCKYIKLCQVHLRKIHHPIVDMAIELKEVETSAFCFGNMEKDISNPTSLIGEKSD